ncbi:aspartate aminotransferase family protein [Brevibacillus marinus]|uniref:aminotransferase family protein n=1 Tax=Brevibacillus marinus TaxID=2496837 RepID=UPI000F84AE25|nr:aminotransferase class III-fold pyridoxal phosphate-dependent enzyme [Brevibacillus marinus]
MNPGSKVFYRDPHKQYPTAKRGKGVFIYDENEKDYLDGSSGALVVNVGHGNEEIIEAVHKQMRAISFAHTSQFQTDVLVEYANRLAPLLPGELEYTYFVAGGSEAVDTAIKMARQYQVERGKTSKHKVIGRWTSFHGHTIGALSVGGYADWRKFHSPNLLAFPHIQPPLCYRCPFGHTPDSCQHQCAAQLEDAILREGPENVAAFIFEPVIGSSASATVAPPVYFQKVSEICKKYDVLLIVDEVMCGFGRTGTLFASEHWNLQPDLMVTGKGISSGYAPLGAVMVHPKVFETLKEGSARRFVHGFTSSGNPVSVSAGLAVLNFLQQNAVLEKVKHTSAYLEKRLKQLQDHHPIIGDVRGIGMMWGVELVRNRASREPFPPELQVTAQTVSAAFANGLIVYPSQKFHLGRYGDSIMIAPPLIITMDEIDLLIERLEKTLHEIGMKLEAYLY